MPKRCSKCGKFLGRIYYKIPEMNGNYCKTCVYDLYRVYGLTFYANDSEDENGAKTENLD